MKNIPDGINLERTGDSIKIQGLSSLDKDLALQVVEYVKQNKEDLLQDMDGDDLPRIEPMDRCLHGGRCKHLNGPGDCRPICDKTGSPVFDLAACPVLKWARSKARKRTFDEGFQRSGSS